MAVGKPFVVQSEKVQNRSVEVVDVHHIFDGLIAELVGGAEAEPALDAGSRKPGCESLGVMVAALHAFLEGGHAAKLGGPDDQGIVEQAADLEVGKQGRGRLVEDRTMALIIRIDAPVAVPVQRAFAHGESTVEEGDEPHAPFQQPASEQAVAAERGQERVWGIEPVEPASGRALPGQIADLGRALLHPSCQLIGGDPGRELAIAGIAPQVFVVDQAEEISARPDHSRE